MKILLKENSNTLSQTKSLFYIDIDELVLSVNSFTNTISNICSNINNSK